jgi:outer membrane receptor protein involved in Fe transport
VLDFIDDPSLVGNRVPQVPLHSGSGAVRYEPGGGFALSAQVRAAGEQFDDDQNRLPLGRYAVVDLLVSRHVGRGFEAFCAFENLLDARYDIGRTPVTTVGAPFSVRGGIRFRLTER